MRLRLLAAALALAPTVALAQSSTLSSTPPPSTPLSTAQGVQTEQQIDQWMADAGDPPAPDDAAPGVADAPRTIHGQADVTLGSNGYRGAHVSALVPIGEDGTLGVAVGDDHFGGRHVSVDRRSLAVSLQLGPGPGPSEPCSLRRTGVKLASDLREDQLCGRGAADAAPVSGPVGAELMGGR